MSRNRSVMSALTNFAGGDGRSGGAGNLRVLVHLLLGYVLLHTGLRLALSGTIAVDDVTEIVFAQTLAPGYDPKQPPFYTWLLYGLSRLDGGSLGDLLLLKYGLLATSLLVFRDILIRTGCQRPLAGIGALGILLLYQIGWNIHEGVTHTLAVMTMSVMALWLFICLAGSLQSQKTAQIWLIRLGLGAVLAAGCLSKYSFPLFLLALMGAALLVPAVRRVLLQPGNLVIPLLAGLFLLPCALWLLDAPAGMDALQRTAAVESEAGYLQRTAFALGKLVTASLGFLVPLLPLVILLRPRLFVFWRREQAAQEDAEAARNGGDWPDSRDWERFFARLALVALGLLALAILAGFLNNVKARWMHPFLLPALPWLWLWLQRRGWQARDSARLLLALGVITLVIAGVRVGRIGYGPPLCGKCRAIQPWDALAEGVRATGFTNGTLIGGDEHVSGNLRVRFPEARLISLHTPFYVPPQRQEGAPTFSPACLLVWNRDTVPEEKIFAKATPLLGLTAQELAALPSQSLQAPRIAPLSGNDLGAVRLGLLTWPEGQGNCR